MWDWKTESILSKGPANVAIIEAHPDDPDHGIAGAAAIWAAMGHTVTYVIVTNGDKGSDDRDLSSADLIATREREQRAAAAALGINDVLFLGWPDGMVVPDLKLRRELVRVMRMLKADVVCCDQPNQFFWGDDYINHPDHRAVAVAVLEGVFPAVQNHRYFPELLAEGYETHRVREVWINTSNELANTIVDVTSVVEKKIAALQSHVSQGLSTDDLPWLREWMAENGKRHEPPVPYAECFKVMRINSDNQDDV